MSEPIQPPYGAIRKRIREGKVVPFLGSGASLGDRDPRANPWNPDDLTYLPNARELAELLAQPASFPRDAEDRELTHIAQYYELAVGRADLDRDLHAVFERPALHAKIHMFLAGLPTPLLIITTNYDDLIERALDAHGRAYDVVVHLTPTTVKSLTEGEYADLLLWRKHGSEPRLVTDDELAEVDPAQRFVVYKMHGGIDRARQERDSYVITEDDYIDFLTRMASQSASAVPSFVLKHLGSDRHLLFLGYGLRDWNLRVLLNQLAPQRQRSVTSWAIQYHPSPLEMRFWRRRKEEVEVYDMKVDDFAEALQRA